MKQQVGPEVKAAIVFTIIVVATTGLFVATYANANNRNERLQAEQPAKSERRSRLERLVEFSQPVVHPRDDSIVGTGVTCKARRIGETGLYKKILVFGTTGIDDTIERASKNGFEVRGPYIQHKGQWSYNYICRPNHNNHYKP